MNKDELIAMVGSEEQADYTLNLVLKNLKPQFIMDLVKIELNEVELEIKNYRGKDVIYCLNGTYRVNWSQNDEDCNKAESLLYKRNRLKSLIAVR